MALEETQDLHPLRKLDQEFIVPFEVMNLRRITARELAHGLNALPIGNRHELGFVLAVLAERLNTQCLVEERLDAGLVVVGFVLVGAVTQGSPAPDADNGGLLERRGVHAQLLRWDGGLPGDPMQVATGRTQAATVIIHGTPKRSATMPKRGDQKVLVSGICTCPPSASAPNTRSASASCATASDSPKPWKLGRPSQRPSEAITVVSPMRKLVCMTLFSEPGGTMPGAGGSGLSLKRMSIVTSAPSA